MARTHGRRRAADARKLLAARNRGVLLDLVVFLLNLVLMRRLTAGFLDLLGLASGGDRAAEVAIGLFFLALFALPAAGAILKRWHFQQWRAGVRAARGGSKRDRAAGGDPLIGCLLHPAFYLAVMLCVAVTAASVLGGRVFGENFHQDGSVFVPLVFGVIVLSIAQTVFVYRYFEPYSKPPRLGLLRDPRGALAGDVCIYLNMILFQVLWNWVTAVPYGALTGLGDLAARAFFLLLAAMFFYFPPRVFYLAEDSGRPVAWLTILLANAPVLLRVLFGLDLTRLF